jgi:hypothetical protein
MCATGKKKVPDFGAKEITRRNGQWSRRYKQPRTGRVSEIEQEDFLEEHFVAASARRWPEKGSWLLNSEGERARAAVYLKLQRSTFGTNAKGKGIPRLWGDLDSREKELEEE